MTWVRRGLSVVGVLAVLDCTTPSAPSELPQTPYFLHSIGGTTLPEAEFPGGRTITYERISFNQSVGTRHLMLRDIQLSDGQRFRVEHEVEFVRRNGELIPAPFTCPPNADCVLFEWTGRFDSAGLTITYRSPSWPSKRYLRGGQE